MNSMSIMGKQHIDQLVGNLQIQDNKSLSNVQKVGIEFFKSYPHFDNLQKSKMKVKPGVINKPKGLYEPDDRHVKSTYVSRGLRYKPFYLNFRVLREVARKVFPVGAIHNVRCLQLEQFTRISKNDDEVGFCAKMKDKDKTPTNKDKKIMREIEEFFSESGYTNFKGAEERVDKFSDIIELVTRDVLAIDQIAIHPRRNSRGEMIDFWLLDGATIRRTIKGRGYDGDKEIMYVQEIDGQVVETFTNEELIFTYMNQRIDINQRGWGYSYLEMCIDAITSWLFAMTYNKEQFNTSTQPKGFLSFQNENMDQSDLEELQRQWVAMFSGIKGMWKTPFLQGNPKWVTMNSSNRDMEFNQYIQVLASWICAIHGIDIAELGIRSDRSQGVLFENPESKIHYSKDRGVKGLVFFHESWMNKVKRINPNWDPYVMAFTGLEAKNQIEELNVDEKQTQVYMTINEKRKEKDLKPIEGGDIISNPNFIQAQQAASMQQQQEQFDEGAEEENIEEDNEAIDQEVNESMKKSQGDFIEIIM